MKKWILILILAGISQIANAGYYNNILTGRTEYAPIVMVTIHRVTSTRVDRSQFKRSLVDTRLNVIRLGQGAKVSMNSKDRK